MCFTHLSSAIPGRIKSDDLKRKIEEYTQAAENCDQRKTEFDQRAEGDVDGAEKILKPFMDRIQDGEEEGERLNFNTEDLDGFLADLLGRTRPSEEADPASPKIKELARPKAPDEAALRQKFREMLEANPDSSYFHFPADKWETRLQSIGHILGETDHWQRVLDEKKTKFEQKLELLRNARDGSSEGAAKVALQTWIRDKHAEIVKAADGTGIASPEAASLAIGNLKMKHVPVAKAAWRSSLGGYTSSSSWSELTSSVLRGVGFGSKKTLHLAQHSSERLRGGFDMTNARVVLRGVVSSGRDAPMLALETGGGVPK